MELSQIMQDEKFSAAVQNAQSAEEIATLLQERGFEVTAEDVERSIDPDMGEMNESELEMVSGGGLLSSIWSYISALRYKAGGGGFSTGGGGKGSFGGGNTGGR